MAEVVTTQQLQLLPQYQEDYLKDVLASARARAETPVGIPAYQVAGLTPAQNQAVQLGISGVGSYAPMMQAGAATLGTGIGGYLQAGEAALGGVPYLQRAGEALQTAAVSAPVQAYAGQAAISQANQMLRGGAQQYDPSKQVGAFMDPYLENVIQQQYRDLARQGQMQDIGARAQAVGAGAFGGSREAVQRAEIGRNVLDQQMRTGAQLRSAGFQQALGSSQQAFEAARQRQLASAGQMAQFGQAGAGLGLQAAQLQGQMGQGLGALGGQFGQLGGQLGQLSQGLSQAGLSQAALGESAQAAQQRDINALLSVGGLEQAQRQQELEAQRATDLQRAYEPYQRIQFMSDIFRGTPSQLTTQTTPSPSALSQIAGLGVGIAGLSQAGLLGGGNS